MRSWIIGLKWVSRAQSMKLWIGFFCDIWRNHLQCEEYAFLGCNSVWFDKKESTNYRQCCYFPDNSILNSFGWQYELVVGSSKDIKPGILHKKGEFFSLVARRLASQRDLYSKRFTACSQFAMCQFCVMNTVRLKPFIVHNTRYIYWEIFYPTACECSLYYCYTSNCTSSGCWTNRRVTSGRVELNLTP
jgi:hypothetical protein